MAKKYLDENGLLYLWQKIKAKFISDVTYNSTSRKLQKTQNGTTSDVVTLSKVATSNSYNDLDNKPTIPSGVEKTTTTPKMDGTAAVGSETKFAAGDHVHPSDTTKVDKVSGKGLSTNDYTDGDKAKVDAITEELLAGGKVHYGECSTNAATTAKTVTTTDGSYKLKIGSAIFVKFTVTNTGAVGSLTLNVDGTGEKPIKYRGSNLPSSGTLSANRLYSFIYDGTNYNLLGDLDTNTTYTNATLGQGYGTCSTAESTTAKVVTLSSYALTTGGVVAVKFTNAVPAKATMNINSKGAKNIYYRGGAITSGVISAGDIATFIYDGTQYQLLTVDTVFTPSEKTKLSGIATGAEVNQNAFSKIAVNGQTTVEADAKTDTLTLVAGSNVTITTNASDDKVTITATDTTYSDATTSTHGLMPASDKTKLNKLLFDSNNRIDSSILPSYVDDVIEAYPRSGQTPLSQNWLATGSASGTVITPEAGKIYVLMADSGDYTTNTQFRWSGTTYVKLNDGGVTSIANAEIDTIIAS